MKKIKSFIFLSIERDDQGFLIFQFSLFDWEGGIEFGIKKIQKKKEESWKWRW